MFPCFISCLCFSWFMVHKARALGRGHRDRSIDDWHRVTVNETSRRVDLDQSKKMAKQLLMRASSQRFFECQRSNTNIYITFPSFWSEYSKLLCCVCALQETLLIASCCWAVTPQVSDVQARLSVLCEFTMMMSRRVLVVFSIVFVLFSWSSNGRVLLQGQVRNHFQCATAAVQ
jgi:hypothetical protein